MSTCYVSTDYDECENGTDECDDYCINTVGSYTCKCLKTGYRLSNDGHTCVGKTCTISLKWSAVYRRYR